MQSTPLYLQPPLGTLHSSLEDESASHSSPQHTTNTSRRPNSGLGGSTTEGPDYGVEDLRREGTHAAYPRQSHHIWAVTSLQAWRQYSLAFLTGPEFRGRYRDQLLELGQNFSIADAEHFLATSRGRPELASTFSTSSRRLRLQAALERFENGINKWRQGERRDPRMTWLTPIETPHPAFVAILDEADQIFQADGEISGSWRTFAPKMDQWLLWLSIELVRTIHSMTSADLGFIRRCLVRLRLAWGITEELYPWTPGFSPHLAELPVHSLYHFEPTASGLRTLNALTSVFCWNVGHLVALDPEAWQVIHGLKLGVWSRLVTVLNESGSQWPAA